MTSATKATAAGRAYLSLQREARAAGRTTAEYLRLYALEGFLLRLSHSPHRNRFVLKGGWDPARRGWVVSPPKA